MGLSKTLSFKPGKVVLVTVRTASTSNYNCIISKKKSFNLKPMAAVLRKGPGTQGANPNFESFH